MTDDPLLEHVPDHGLGSRPDDEGILQLGVRIHDELAAALVPVGVGH